MSKSKDQWTAKTGGLLAEAETITPEQSKEYVSIVDSLPNDDEYLE